MCIHLGSGARVKPGSQQIVRFLKGTGLFTYGIGNGLAYNARFESLKTVWRSIEKNKGIFRIESYWEGHNPPVEFIRIDGKLWNIGVIFNSREFAIVTVPPNSLVEKHHRRQALCIEDSSVESWLNNGSFNTMTVETYKINESQL